MLKRTDRRLELLRRFLRRKSHTPVLAQFRDALMREILLTERLRVRAVIVTVSMFVAVMSALDVFAPSVLGRISHGRFELAPLYRVYVPFLLYEFMVLYLLARRLAMHSDVPWARRYLSALIETSIPTFVLYLHMRLDGFGAGAGICGAAGLFSLHRAVDAAARFLALHLHGLCCRGRIVRDGDAVSPGGFCRRAATRTRLRADTQRDISGRRYPGGRGRRSVAASVRGQHRRGHRARPRHQFVRPACLPRGGRAVAGRGRGDFERHSPGRRHVRRFPQLHRGRAVADAAGGGRAARWRLRRAGRNTRSSRRHRQQVPRRRLSGAVRRAVRGRRGAASCGRCRARDAGRDERHQPRQRAGRCGSASAFTSARWWPAISARPGARNIP